MPKTIEGGLFITFSGPEGCGKTTQIQMLADRLRKQGWDVLVTKEPGGDEDVCKAIRSILLSHHPERISGFTELLLFSADRRHHIETVILPALRAGKIVLCDRWVPDTFAYQCHARKAVTAREFHLLMDSVTSIIRPPDLSFWLRISPRMSLERVRARGKADRIESEGTDFHEAICAGFARCFTAEKKRKPLKWVGIDGTASIEEVAEEIWCHMQLSFEEFDRKTRKK